MSLSFAAVQVFLGMLNQGAISAAARHIGRDDCGFAGCPRPKGSTPFTHRAVNMAG